MTRSAINEICRTQESFVPKLKEAWRLELKVRDPLQQYVYVYVQPSHFVDEHVDKKHDERYQLVERKILFLIFTIPVSLYSMDLST